MNKPSREHAKRLHSESLVVDAHSDTILELWLHPKTDFAQRNEESFDMDLPRLLEAGVTAEVMAVCNGDSPASVARNRPERMAVPVHVPEGDIVTGLASALDCIELVYRDAARLRDKMTVATRGSDIRAAKSDGKLAVLMSVESRLPTGSTVDTLKAFHRLGVRCVALSGYERRGNSTSDVELDPFALELVEQMDRLGIVLDVSHMLEGSFWKVTEAVTGPFVDTHANAYSLCPHWRNLKDEQLKALAEHDGVVGAMCYKPYVDEGDPSLLRMLDHVDHISKVVGVEHVGLGLDFDGMGGAGGNGVLRDVSEVPLIAEGLVQRGYSDDEVKMILGENFMRVFNRVIG